MSQPSILSPQSSVLFLIREVHNFGGFFGGDTVTFTATPRATPDDEQTLTLDEKALTNVADRYTITAGMLLALEFTGDRIERAELLGAATHAELRAALGPAAPTGAGILSYRCEACNLWIAGAPVEGKCRVCSTSL